MYLKSQMLTRWAAGCRLPVCVALSIIVYKVYLWKSCYYQKRVRCHYWVLWINAFTHLNMRLYRYGRTWMVRWRYRTVSLLSMLQVHAPPEWSALLPVGGQHRRRHCSGRWAGAAAATAAAAYTLAAFTRRASTAIAARLSRRRWL